MTAEQAIERSISHNEIVTLDYSRDALSFLSSECDDSAEAHGATEFWGTSEDGDDWRVHVRDCTDVVIEIMPDQHRGSHRAARNWGSYPHNGAERYRVDAGIAENLCEDDEYNHVVKGADPEEYEAYAL